jgi:hypothetical protein
MRHPLTSKQAVSGIHVLLECLAVTQTLLAQIVNDPENPRNGHAAAAMLRENAEIMDIVKGRLT